MRLLYSAPNGFSPPLYPQPQSLVLHPTATRALLSPRPQGRAIKSFMLQLEAIKLSPTCSLFHRSPSHSLGCWSGPRGGEVSLGFQHSHRTMGSRQEGGRLTGWPEAHSQGQRASKEGQREDSIPASWGFQPLRGFSSRRTYLTKFPWSLGGEAGGVLTLSDSLSPHINSPAPT